MDNKEALHENIGRSFQSVDLEKGESVALENSSSEYAQLNGDVIGRTWREGESDPFHFLESVFKTGPFAHFLTNRAFRAYLPLVLLAILDSSPESYVYAVSVFGKFRDPRKLGIHNKEDEDARFEEYSKLMAVFSPEQLCTVRDVFTFEMLRAEKSRNPYCPPYLKQAIESISEYLGNER